jgi:ABC-type lipoprotein export system ATPase subunit
VTAVAANDLFYLYRAAHGDVAALRGLNMTVADGEVVSVLGPSGSGKSTLLSLFSGFRRPSGGALTILDRAAEQLGERQFATLRRTSIGVVRQHYHRALPAELTAQEIVELPSRLLGRAGRIERRRAHDLLERAGLADRAGARPRELSGGEQQRVGVCAALAKRPRLLLADEPTGELDASATTQVVDLILELAADSGTAAVIVTHDAAVAARTARTIQIRDGRLAAEGTGDPVLIVDDHGWLRIPRDLRELAGLGTRVRAHATGDRVELRPARDTVVDDTAVADPAADAATRAIALPVPVRLDDVTLAYAGRRVLNGISAHLEAGRLHAFAGPSGSGKTTLLNVVAAVERPDDGEIWLGGHRIDHLSPKAAARVRRDVVGYASQHSTLVEFLTARENVELGLQLRGVTGAEATRRAEGALDQVGLAKLAGRRADRLSGGEQRRVALARALAPTPSVLVADEPTAHLDRANGRHLTELLAALAHDHGTTVIVATHDADVVARADTVLRPGDVRPR